MGTFNKLDSSCVSLCVVWQMNYKSIQNDLDLFEKPGLYSALTLVVGAAMFDMKTHK